MGNQDTKNCNCISLQLDYLVYFYLSKGSEYFFCYLVTRTLFFCKLNIFPPSRSHDIGVFLVYKAKYRQGLLNIEYIFTNKVQGLGIYKLNTQEIDIERNDAKCLLIITQRNTYFENLSAFRVPPQNIFQKFDKWRCSLSKPACKTQTE